jgi:hypothetical protein
MSNTTYNGWTNYATWRVNLEIFDGMDIMDYLGPCADIGTLSLRMKEYAENIIEDQTSENSIAQSYALAFLADVNWYEIAKHYHEEVTQ